MNIVCKIFSQVVQFLNPLCKTRPSSFRDETIEIAIEINFFQNNSGLFENNLQYANVNTEKLSEFYYFATICEHDYYYILNRISDEERRLIFRIDGKNNLHTAYNVLLEMNHDDLMIWLRNKKLTCYASIVKEKSLSGRGLIDFIKS